MTKNTPPKVKTRHMPRGDLRYLIGAAALVVVVGALALVFGIVRPPAFEGLTAAQGAALPGGVAWTEYNERSDCTDLMVARPNGEVESVKCLNGLDRVIGWTEDGIVTVSYGESGERMDTRDPVTGDVLLSRDVAGYDDRPADQGDGAVFSAERRDGSLVLVDHSGTPVWETQADARYEIGTIAGSPDGNWVAMTDSAERLLVVRADGSEPPAIWATGIVEWSWMDLIWEGTEPPT
jgi:hypothetical protein